MFRPQGKTSLFKKILILLAIPLVWIVLDQSWDDEPDFLTPLENLAMDWRFAVRGEMSAPVKVFYVDIDEKGLELLGEPPWDYTFFADVAEMVFGLGHARALGFGFIFSPKTKSSQLVSYRKARASDKVLAQAIKEFPNIVLGANYDDPPLENWHDVINPLQTDDDHFPFIEEEDYLQNKRGYPEMPTYPIVGPDWGNVGLIDFYRERDAGPVPRWVPLFAEYAGTEHALYIIRGAQEFEELSSDKVLNEDEHFVLHCQNGKELIRVPKVDSQTFYHMAIELFLKYHRLDHSAIQVEDHSIKIVGKKGQILASVPLANKQILEVNWFSKWKNNDLNPRCSIADLYNNLGNYFFGTYDQKQNAQQFFLQMQNAIVLVGAVDESLQDVSPTPFDEYPVPNIGVEGNLLKTLFSGEYIHRLPVWVVILVIFLLTLCLTSVGIYSGRHKYVYRWLMIGIFLSYIIFVFVAFCLWHLVLPLIAPVGAALTTLAGGLVLRFMDYEAQKHRIKALFGTYVSPELVDRMVEEREEPEIGGTKEIITSLFSDVYNFSEISENLDPTDLVGLMNEYLGEMTEVLKDQGGTLDKYIGDGIVAMFGAPVALENHALRACLAAWGMKRCQIDLSKKWIEEKRNWATLVETMSTRIGLSTGEATVGNMGSQTRFNYTMMGDSVNLASRVEMAAKFYGVSILVTETTKTQAEDYSSQCIFRLVDDVIVPGRKKPVKVYELVDLREFVSSSVLECIELYEQAFNLYQNRQFVEAQKLLERAILLEPAPKAEPVRIYRAPSHVLLERCRYLEQTPPTSDWRGIFTLPPK